MNGQAQALTSARLASTSNPMTAPPRTSYLSEAERRRLADNLQKLNARSKPTGPKARPITSTLSSSSQRAAPPTADQQQIKPSVSQVNKNDQQRGSHASQPIGSSSASFRIRKREDVAGESSQSHLKNANNKLRVDAARTKIQNGCTLGALKSSTVPPPRMSITEALKAAQKPSVLQRPAVVSADSIRPGPVRNPVSVTNGRPAEHGVAKQLPGMKQNAPPAAAGLPYKVTSLDDILKLKRAGLLAPSMISKSARAKKSVAVERSRAVAKPVTATTTSANKWSLAAVRTKPVTTTSTTEKPTANGSAIKSTLTKTSSSTVTKPAVRGVRVQPSSSSIVAGSSSKSPAENDINAKLAAMQAEIERLRAERDASSSQIPDSRDRIAEPSTSRSGGQNSSQKPSRPGNSAARSSASISGSRPSPPAASTTTGFIMPNVKRKLPPARPSAADSNTISLSALKRNASAAALHSAIYADEYEEDDMADFVVDDDEDVGNGDDDAQAELDKMFSGYRKRARRDLDAPYDDRAMESSWMQQQAEEIRSKKVGLHEDLQEDRLQKAQDKAKKFAKESKKLKKRLKKFEQNKKSPKKDKKKKNRVDDDSDG